MVRLNLAVDTPFVIGPQRQSTVHCSLFLYSYLKRKFEVTAPVSRHKSKFLHGNSGIIFPLNMLSVFLQRFWLFMYTSFLDLVFVLPRIVRPKGPRICHPAWKVPGRAQHIPSRNTLANPHFTKINYSKNFDMHKLRHFYNLC